MISFAEACERCDTRLKRLIPEGEGEAHARPSDVGATCMGSDVPGPGLDAVLQGATLDALARSTGIPCEHGDVAEANCLLAEGVKGALLGSFWLGYEMGKAERE